MAVTLSTVAMMAMVINENLRVSGYRLAPSMRQPDIEAKARKLLQSAAAAKVSFVLLMRALRFVVRCV